MKKIFSLREIIYSWQLRKDYPGGDYSFWDFHVWRIYQIYIKPKLEPDKYPITKRKL